MTTLEELVADGAERLDREGPGALDALCAAHPQHASALREALLPLLRFGVAGPTGALQPAAVDVPTLLPPRRLGEFEIVREIGRGGMGVVYEARQTSLDRLVALKVLPPRWVQDPRQVTRFQNEARAAATLDHPGIVPVWFVGEEDGTHYYAMQLIAGASLRSLLDQLATDEPDPGVQAILHHLLPASALSGRISGTAWHRAADLAAQAAEALAKAHAVGILHRDVKPGNLLIDREGRLWITDFGLAHFLREDAELTRSGEFVGTLAYCSPEQLTGNMAVDARSDVYALGATLYEMLTLRPPFAGNQAAVIRQVATDEPRPPRSIDARIPRDLETIVLRAMAKEAPRRYPSAADMAGDLRAFLTGQPISARRLTAAQRSTRWCRHNPVLAGSLAGLVLLAVVLIGTGLIAWRTAGERDRALRAEAAITRLSNARKIDACIDAARVLRQSLAAGRRFASLDLLRDATAVLGATTVAVQERTELSCRLRSDAIASLSSWDATVEDLLPADPTAVPLAFDPSFTWCALQRGGALSVCERDGRELARLPHPAQHTAVEFTADPDWVVISNPGVLRLWNWRDGRVIVPPGGRAERAFCSAMHTVFTVADRTHVSACDLATGTCRDGLTQAQQALVADGGPFHAISVDARAERLAVCATGSSRLIVFDLRGTRHAVTVALPDDPWQVAWEPDGRHVVTGGRFLDLLRLDLDRQLVVGRWPGHHAEVTALRASPGGELLASVGWDSQVRVWQSTGEPLLSLPTGTTPRQALFSNDGQTLGWVPSDGDRGPVRRWRLHPPAVVRTIELPPRAHTGLPDIAFHPSLPLLAVAMRDCVLFLEARSHALLGELHVEAPQRVRFLASGDLFVASGGEPGGCIAPLAADGANLRLGPLRPVAPARGAECTDVTGETIVAFDGSALRVIDGERVRTVAATLPDAVHLRCSADGRFAALGAFPGGTHAAIWNLATAVKELEVPVWQSTAFVAFSPDGSQATVSRRDAHLVFATDGWRPLATIARPQVAATCGTCGYSPDGRLLAVPMTRVRIRLFDARTFTPLFDLDVPDGATANEPTFSPDGTTLALLSIHRRLFAWDLRAMRIELAAMGLDWDSGPLPPGPSPSPPFRLQIVE